GPVLGPLAGGVDLRHDVERTLLAPGADPVARVEPAQGRLVEKGGAPRRVDGLHAGRPGQRRGDLVRLQVPDDVHLVGLDTVLREGWTARDELLDPVVPEEHRT